MLFFNLIEKGTMVMEAPKNEERYFYNTYENQEPLISDYTPGEVENKLIEARMKEVIFFANIAAFSVSLVILLYLLMNVMPVILAIPLAFLISYSIVPTLRRITKKINTKV